MQGLIPRAVFTLALLLIWVSAQASTTITYQGQLKQSGTPYTGFADLEFRLFDQLSGGNQVGPTQTREDWPVEDGLFQVELDFGAPAFSGSARYLEVRVDGSALNPRQTVRPSPMALFALAGNEGPPGPPGDTGPEGPAGPPGDSSWVVSGPDILFDGGRVGVGTALPGAGLHSVQTNAAGLGGETNTALAGVFGWNKGTSGSVRGVQGVSNSTSGQGVYGWVSPSSGTTTGVWGESASSSGRGLFGLATANSGETHGVLGVSDSVNGKGVSGTATATAGSTVGVSGSVASASGIAGSFSGPLGSLNYFQRRVGIGLDWPNAQLHVRADGFTPDPLRLVRSNGTEAMRVNSAGNVGIGTTSPGVRLDVTAPSGNVVRATHSNSHIGVLGDTNAGVYGEQGGAGFTARAWLGHANGIGLFAQSGNVGGIAGRFEGNVVVTGNLSKGGGSFQIDHPLDPENKYLFHSFVESPDMMNIYNGNVVTDASGHAEVELPEYFEVANKEFRNQLTVIGTFAQAIIAEEIEANRFVIATSAPNVKVSWQVTGIRDDAWARAHRIEVEVPKPEHERGRYLHPEAFGLDVDRQED